ncbi:Lysozyme c-1 [Halotydeus destructor]|nr:Lysozyme c-1 [Halotydeus destructor]
MAYIAVLMLVTVAATGSLGKTYTPCALAKELVHVHKFDRSSIYDWICLVEAESSFRTNALGKNKNGSKDYGLFQVNDGYWCAPPGPHNDCKVNCNKLIDDDIHDDVRCIRIIHKRHGFDAWYGWKNKCRGNNRGRQLLAGCTL